MFARKAAMSILTRLVFVLGLALAAAPTFSLSEDKEDPPPPLLVLQYINGSNAVSVPVPYRAGLALSPERGRPAERWRILPGERFRTERRPSDRAVSLYQGLGSERQLLCIVYVRYYRDEEGRWTPHFQLYEEPLVVPRQGRWQPYTTARGHPLLIVQTGTSLPNAEGYAPWLEFGFSAGSVTIDAWLVR
jgi:hypothetical protein